LSASSFSQKRFLFGFVFIAALLAVALFNKSKTSYESNEITTPQKSVHQGQAMGTSFSVVYFTEGVHSEKVIHEKINQAIALVNNQMSTYKNDSNLSIFNQKPEGSCYRFPVDTYRVIEMAQSISALTDGAFDVTVGPLVNLWGFGPQYKPEIEPSDEQIQNLKSTKVGYQNLELKDDNIVCKSKDIYVDLSAIAKGYAVDLVAEALDQLSISSYLVEIGGELKAKGLKLNQEVWRIAVENPNSEQQRSVHKVLELNNTGIATSGDYRNYYEIDGKRVSHTINPETGKPIEHNLASISVLHDSVAYADALATAFNVMGPDKALALADKEQLAVYMLLKNDQGFEVKSTPAFTDNISN